MVSIMRIFNILFSIAITLYFLDNLITLKLSNNWDSILQTEQCLPFIISLLLSILITFLELNNIKKEK